MALSFEGFIRLQDFRAYSGFSKFCSLGYCCSFCVRPVSPGTSMQCDPSPNYTVCRTSPCLHCGTQRSVCAGQQRDMLCCMRHMVRLATLCLSLCNRRQQNQTPSDTLSFLFSMHTQLVCTIGRPDGLALPNAPAQGWRIWHRTLSGVRRRKAIQVSGSPPELSPPTS